MRGGIDVACLKIPLGRWTRPLRAKRGLQEINDDGDFAKGTGES